MRRDAVTGSERGLYDVEMLSLNMGLAALHLFMSDSNTTRMKLIVIYLNIRPCMLWCSVRWCLSVLLRGRAVFTAKLFELLLCC